ncbi:MAG: hypothetical protein SFY80_14840 [Verrucomicrobiota bacterium]|nr:hypothetical protein [Verrucomicrobiota bacterium]
MYDYAASRLIVLIAPLGLLMLGFSGCRTAPRPPARTPVPVVQEVPPVFTPPIAKTEDSKAPVPTDLAFLPVSTVSEPMTGSPTIPFNEVSPEIRSKLDAMDFKPSVFPFNETGGGLAFNALVGIPRLEVQDLQDGRIRILARITNRATKDLRLYVGCEPTDSRDAIHERREQIGVLLAKDVFRDFSFIINGPVNRKFILSCDAKAIGEEYRKLSHD